MTENEVVRKYKRIKIKMGIVSAFFAVMTLPKASMLFYDKDIFLGLNDAAAQSAFFTAFLVYFSFYSTIWKCPKCGRFPGGGWTRKACGKCGVRLI